VIFKMAATLLLFKLLTMIVPFTLYDSHGVPSTCQGKKHA